jgi:hypothetical protein
MYNILFSKYAVYSPEQTGKTFFGGLKIINIFSSILSNYRRYSCLYDDPFDNGYAKLEDHPGERYSMDEQCRFNFGKGWSVCHQVSTVE